MSNDKTSSVLEDNAKPGVTDLLINKQNLALLHKRDRTVIMGVGLVMSIAGTTIVTQEATIPRRSLCSRGLRSLR